VQEVLVTEDELQLALCQVPGDEKDDVPLGLNDQELVVAPLESYGEFQEDEEEVLSA
jgi:hypothetical protein